MKINHNKPLGKHNVLFWGTFRSKKDSTQIREQENYKYNFRKFQDSIIHTDGTYNTDGIYCYLKQLTNKEQPTD